MSAYLDYLKERAEEAERKWQHCIANRAWFVRIASKATTYKEWQELIKDVLSPATPYELICLQKMQDTGNEWLNELGKIVEAGEKE